MKKMYHKIRVISLLLIALLTVSGLVGCGKQKETEAPTEDTSYLDAYEKYVISVLDANYRGDYAAYISITGASEEEAKKISQAHAVSLAGQLADVYDIKLAQLPSEIGDGLVSVCRDIYKKAGYSVSKVEKSGESVYVTVEIQPMKFVETASSSVAKYTGDFNDRGKAGEFESMTPSQYENEYAKGLLEVLEGAVKEISYADPTNYRLKIQYDAQTGVSYIGEADLDKINQLILAE